MSIAQHRIDTYLPDFQKAVAFSTACYPNVPRIEILEHSFSMIKKIHFNLTPQDKMFLFKNVVDFHHDSNFAKIRVNA